jgi:hypothetical protein
VLWVLVFTTVLEFVFFIMTQGAACRGSCQHSCHLWIVRPGIFMTQEELQRWERTRSEGHERFILRQLLREGVPFGLAVLLCMVVFDIFAHHPIEPVWQLLVDFGFLALVFGYGMGEFRWRRFEREFQKSRNESQKAQP